MDYLLFCVNHPEKIAKRHCNKCDQDLCNECVFDSHIEHHEEIAKIEYSIDDAFRECDELKEIALESRGKDGKPNVAGAIKAVEMKVKLKGLLSDDAQFNNNNGFQNNYN